METMNPVEKKEVTTKSLRALEELGHMNLELDEYESVYACAGASTLTHALRCLQGK